MSAQIQVAQPPSAVMSVIPDFDPGSRATMLGDHKKRNEPKIKPGGTFKRQLEGAFYETNRAPSKAGAIQQVIILPGQRIASRPEYNYTYKEVTNYARL